MSGFAKEISQIIIYLYHLLIEKSRLHPMSQSNFLFLDFIFPLLNLHFNALIIYCSFFSIF